MSLFFITITGIFLRLINIIKPEGLWNDEYVSWFIASTPFNQGFWNEVIKQCHMPLYYLWLKPFAGMSDTILRLTSVVPGCLAIIVMYYAGRELSKKTGLYAAVITSVLPFLIYYSQEVRFYSLLFLFSALSLLFLIRAVKNGKKRDYIFFVISSILILATHVLGIIYVFFSGVYLLHKRKPFTKTTVAIIAIITLILLPSGINILKMLPSSQWWGSFSYTNLVFLFTDFLSPILTNNINAPKTVFYSKDLLLNLLMIIPAILGTAGIILGGLKNRGLAAIAVGVITIMSLLAISGKIVFITKYSIEILPIFILLLSAGFQDKYKDIILWLFIAINLSINLLPQYKTPKDFRSEGHNIPASILNNENPDKIIFTYYSPDRFLRYMKINPPMEHISKINRFEYVKDPERKLSNINTGEKVSVVFLDSVSFIPENHLKEAEEIGLPEMFITFSAIRAGLEKELLTECETLTRAKYGSWTVLNCVKK